ncbi:oxalurate catabolism protein HpxZ [Bosea sp. (in: a-proteobacteria)]|uniref:oxalurate catabolism protein HpxZ n=1 Tax=Bosea sp. (in: a-proteobacteria) TaxID=1871050 RepID=UPI0040345A2A
MSEQTPGMTIDQEAVVAEVADAFAGYEQALMGYDPAALDGFFWSDDRAVRFGIAENLYGHAAIAAYRRTRTSVPQRVLSNTRIIAIGRDAAAVSTEFRYPGDPRIGRQSQTWARMPEGWRVVAAHVSFQEDVER